MKVGKIKKIKYDEENDILDITISIFDPKFRKEILRNLSLKGMLKIEDDNLVFMPPGDVIYNGKNRALA